MVDQVAKNTTVLLILLCAIGQNFEINMNSYYSKCLKVEDMEVDEKEDLPASAAPSPAKEFQFETPAKPFQFEDEAEACIMYIYHSIVIPFCFHFCLGLAGFYFKS